MEGFGKFAGIAGVLAALLAIGSAFETFTNFGLVAKLSIACVAAFGLSLSAASFLASWTKRATDIPGFGRDTAPSPKGRVAVSLAALLLATGLAIFLSFFLIAQFATHVDESTAKDKSSALLTATLSKVDRITIQLPDRKGSSCRWSDQSSGIERADLQIIDWDSPIPKLQVDNFHYPQKIMIECRPASRLRGIFVEPASAVLYRAEQIGSLRFWVVVIGGMIWLVACGRFASLLWR